MAILHRKHFDVIVIGGGFYGCEIANFLSLQFSHIAVIEQKDALLSRASFSNQARIHAGHHYPRNLRTATRSAINYPHFIADYQRAVITNFDSYYAISRLNSKINAGQFRLFMQRAGARIAQPQPKVLNYFDSSIIEDVFLAEESIFDATVLKEIVLEKMIQNKIAIALQTTAIQVSGLADGKISVLLQDVHGATETITADRVYNCTYSGINRLLADSGLPLLSLKYELTELALVDVPPQFENIGITVMCGPFFSLMPFPALQKHTLSHVRYTPHVEWQDSPQDMHTHVPLALPEARSKFVYMQRDGMRYVPALKDVVYSGESLWEFKTILPVTESDDARPILFKKNCGIKNFHAVLGSKIDNIYDILQEIQLDITSL